MLVFKLENNLWLCPLPSGPSGMAAPPSGLTGMAAVIPGPLKPWKNHMAPQTFILWACFGNGRPAGLCFTFGVILCSS